MMRFQGSKLLRFMRGMLLHLYSLIRNFHVRSDVAFAREYQWWERVCPLDPMCTSASSMHGMDESTHNRSLAFFLVFNHIIIFSLVLVPSGGGWMVWQVPKQGTRQ